MPLGHQLAHVSCADRTNPLEKPRESTMNHTILGAAACRTCCYRASPTGPPGSTFWPRSETADLAVTVGCCLDASVGRRIVGEPPAEGRAVEVLGRIHIGDGATMLPSEGRPQGSRRGRNRTLAVIALTT